MGLQQRGYCPALGMASVCTNFSTCEGLYNVAGHKPTSAVTAGHDVQHVCKKHLRVQPAGRRLFVLCCLEGMYLVTPVCCFMRDVGELCIC